ncbi:MAG: peptidase [Thermodesulfobacteriota bacterium]|nr:MAG: peptidase [Thermodesulfobacteriota bacterium]
MRTRFKIALSFCAFALLLFGPLVGCEKLNLSKLPTSAESLIGSVTENVEVPPKVLDTLSSEAVEFQLKTYKDNQQIVTLKKVEEIYESLVQAAKRSDQFSEVANAFDWQLAVIADKEKQKNAYAVPGGRVVVHKGIFSIAKHRAGLAAVLGHEIAHSLARHAGKRMNKKVMTAITSGIVAGGGTGAGVSFTDLDPKAKAAMIAGLGLSAGVAGYAGADYVFQPDMEFEADKEALFLAADAGYDPTLVLTFWQNLTTQKVKANKDYQFLKLHPVGEDRLKALLQHREQAEETYENARKEGRDRNSSDPLPGIA